MVSLFLETAYSFNGSNIKIDTLIKKAKAYQYSTLVLTDTKMHAAYKFYQLSKAAQINPIIGLQLKAESLLNTEGIFFNAYAKSEQGYQNLLKLSSLQSFNEVLPLNLIKKYTKDVSFLILPHKGDFFQLIHDERQFNQVINELKTFIDTLYFGFNEDFKPMFTVDKVNLLPLDYVFYLEEDDNTIHKTLCAIYQNETTIFKDYPAYFKPKEAFNYKPSLLNHLNQFVKDHTLSLSEKTPSLPIFKNTHNLSSNEYLNALSHKGLDKRLKGYKGDKTVYITRLKEELSTIHTMGYDDYFLIVWDVIRYAKKEGILVGPGRGSAPGSLVAYSLGITDIDPIQFGLLFERFLNKDRISMPDIDIDFPDRKRETMIEYTINKYGKEYVSYICTFGTYLKKSALRESARVFQIEKKYIEEMAKKLDHYDSIDAMIKENLDVQNRMQQLKPINHWLKTASKLEGLPKHVSTHAAGIILSHEPIVLYSAIQEGLNQHYQTQYAMEDLEAIGLLKMDFLGLRNLTMIEDILALIKKHENVTLNLYQIPLDDPATFKLLREKSPTGIFQLESAGMRRLIKDMQMKSFDDIVTILALFRPGPMQSIDTYLKRRFKKETIEYIDPILEPILKETEGILLYQEQIMAIASKYAGYSMTEADLLRRAVSKKSETILQNERKRFVKKAQALGKNPEKSNQIYDYIVTFANYGFNKSHSVAYATIAYWMAYLKANYPAYFIAVLMQSALATEALMREYIQEAALLNITISPPHINHSDTYFVYKNKTLYYPLTGIKNIGKTLAENIVKLRENGYQSLIDFIQKTNQVINKRALEYLIYSGALDTFGLSKRTMIENIEAITHYLSYQGINNLEYEYNKKEEFEEALLKHYETEAMGFNLSMHPLKAYEALLKQPTIYQVGDLEALPLNKTIKLLAYVSKIKEIKTKNNEPMAFFQLEDQYNKIDAVCFPNAYIKVKAFIEHSDVLLFEGKKAIKKNASQFVIEKANLITKKD
ncbi:MAG: DNA polymerase III subunit alpha [Candidatus Izemoplasmataceae bacterium]